MPSKVHKYPDEMCWSARRDVVLLIGIMHELPFFPCLFYSRLLDVGVEASSWSFAVVVTVVLFMFNPHVILHVHVHVLLLLLHQILSIYLFKNGVMMFCLLGSWLLVLEQTSSALLLLGNALCISIIRTHSCCCVTILFSATNISIACLSWGE